MNAGEIQDFLTEHFHRPVTTAEVAVCLRLQDKIRMATLKEVGEWLLSHMSIEALLQLAQIRQQFLPHLEDRVLTVNISPWDLTCFEHGKLPEEVKC